MKMNNKQRIKDFLMEGGALSKRYAEEHLGIKGSSQRISDLKKDGVLIDKKQIDGETCWISRTCYKERNKEPQFYLDGEIIEVTKDMNLRDTVLEALTENDIDLFNIKINGQDIAKAISLPETFGSLDVVVESL